jgi:hypothetical protein
VLKIKKKKEGKCVVLKYVKEKKTASGDAIGAFFSFIQLIK